MSDIFETMTRASGDLSGVFESDSEASYFYLYQTVESDGQKVMDSIRICVGEPDFIETDISIRWDSSNQKVGLFIRNVIWAVFDTVGNTKFGGNYSASLTPTIPPDSCFGFST